MEQKERLAPIVIFAFNRPKALKRMIDSLRRCILFNESKIILFIDGPRNKHDEEGINEVISIGKRLTDDVRVSSVNQGLGNSIIAGVSEVIKIYGKAIVLEDDLILMPRFLQFMNEALNAYENDDRILSICGYSLKIKRPANYASNIYLGDRSSSWGWATWQNRWEKVDWKVSDWDTFKRDAAAKRAFNKAGSDMYGMLRLFMEGRNKSWAIRFCYHQFRQELWSVHPFKSLVDNEGFGADATNCKQEYSRFMVTTDKEESPGEWLFYFPLEPDQRILKQLHFYHSITMRIWSKVRNLLHV